MKLAISGAAGRMGQAVTRLALGAGDVTIVGAVDAHDSKRLGTDLGETAGVGTLGVAIDKDVAAALLGAEVVIDFSAPASLRALLRAAAQAGVPVVSGTTGLDDEARTALERAAERVAVLWAPNMSIGVQVLRLLVAQAVEALGPGYDVEIVETHHDAKVDAPSGTALDLARAVREVRPELDLVHGRHGRSGPRPETQIGLHALRGGGVVGDHQIHLLGPLERLELSHRAIHRDLFAEGALRAARYLVGKPPGRYGLGDVIA